MTEFLSLSRTVRDDDAGVWCAYHYLDGAPALLMVGALDYVISPKKTNNGAWRRIASQEPHEGRKLETRLFGPFPDNATAQATVDVLAAIDPPYCPSGARGVTDCRPVVCRGDGRMFESVRNCAKTCKIDISALRKHLKRQTGFRSVKGKEYVYFDELPAEQQEDVRRMQGAQG